MVRPLALFVLLISPAFAQNDFQKDFPEGPAKQYIENICLQCHQPSQLLSQRKTESDWRATIQRMSQRISQKGIAVPADRYDAITAYMIKYFPKTEDPTKIDMNKATAEQIAGAALGLTLAEAKALVAYREKHGDYREWGDMLVVYGVDGRKLEAVKDRMSF